jgi:hypothetical protein
MSRFHKAPSPDIPHTFAWHPGEGPLPACAARMRERIRKPTEPMGEAWFMGEKRRMYTELSGDLEALPEDALTKPLFEIASGTGSFGPMPEWDLWCRYLVARLAHGHGAGSFSDLYPALVTAFLVVHPQGIDEMYGGYGDDVRHTLGHWLMHPARWRDGRLALAPPEGQGSGWQWYRAGHELSVAMFFCAKTVPEEELGAWLDSAFAIDCPLWLTQLVWWFVGADALLAGRVAQVARLADDGGSDILWMDAHTLHGRYATGIKAADLPPFLSPARRAALVAAVCRNVDEARYFAWLDAIKPYETLQWELGTVPSQFAALYLDA